MGLERTTTGKTFVTIIGEQPQLRVATNAENPAAIKREYENPRTKEKGVKYELGYDRLSGHINDISIQKTNFGKQLHITLGDVVLSLSLEFSYAISLLKRLPNINFSKEITLVPYNFESDGKSRRGITVYQNDEKIPDYFFDIENKKTINGYPTPEGDTSKFDSDDWKEYFIKCKKFLQTYLEENIVNKIEPEKDFKPVSLENNSEVKSEDFVEAMESENEKIDIEDIPF